MIKKIIKIRGTGKFLNYTSNSVPASHKTTDFEKINLLYGENGSGKTTLLMSILKRNLIMGLCPPARILASSPCCFNKAKGIS